MLAILGNKIFQGGPNISESFGPGDLNIMGLQIFHYSSHTSQQHVDMVMM